jgi:3-oxoacyl-[acyl-carrier-protein] synthase II
MTQGAPVAVVGMACRFPGAGSLTDLSDLLRGGRVGYGPAPPQRRRIWGEGGPAVKVAGLIDGIETFDRTPFRLSGTEAPLIDPQQRLALEVAWHALEDAGLSPACLEGMPIGVFIGGASSEHAIRLAKGGIGLGNPHLPNAVQNGAISGRISYCLGLTGPSMTVDAACASSLAAVAQAGDALRLGQCDLALAGGVNALLTLESFAALGAAGLLSGTGAGRPFDAAADGFVRSEGAGMLVLKRLADAEAEGDRIHAILPGWAVAHNGRSNGLSAPSREAQVQVIRAAQRAAGVTPDQVGMIEAHGSATSLADTVEAAALAEVFAGRKGPPVWLGAVKAALGHLEAASGMAALIKAILMVRDAVVPKQPGFDSPSPRIDWAGLPCVIARETQPWLSPRRVAGVSGFGMNGLNAHVVVASAAAAKPRPAPASAPFLISAASPASLAVRASQLAGLVATSGVPLAQLAAAVSRRWSGMSHRAQFLAASPQEARESALRIAARPPARPPPLAGPLTLGAAEGLGAPDLAALCRAFPGLRDAARGPVERATAVHLGEGPAPIAALLALHGCGAVFRPQALFAANPAAPDLPPYPFVRLHCWPDSSADPDNVP